MSKMHRAYQPILPCGNKYLQQKWDKTYYDEHKRKVQSAKPMVDTNSPQTYVHLNLKLKKLQLEEERLTVIERDNRLLLEKMSAIMRTKGRVDNTNNYEAKSLNKEKREQELQKVSKENQTIGDRLTRCEPQYRVEKWHEDWAKAEKYMDSIAKYPRGWYAMQQSEKNLKGKKKVAKKESVTGGKAKRGKDDDSDRRSMGEMETEKQEEVKKDNIGSIRESEDSELDHERKEKTENKDPQKNLKEKEKIAKKESVTGGKAKGGKDDDNDRRSVEETETEKQEEVKKGIIGSVRESEDSELEREKKEKTEDEDQQKVDDKEEIQENKDNKWETEEDEDLTKLKEDDNKLLLDEDETKYDDSFKDDESHHSEQSESEHEADDDKEEPNDAEQDPDVE
ncbi:uncharacterized protein CFAP97D2 [Dendropsophus ebraccatus]|uniref:uncharacterized protein CFAP97D2 n=1 Tax=Dendropsophus ebraccatus TaxID=150705 RepID=UPI003831A688